MKQYKQYALIKKTFPLRRRNRRTYYFIALLKNWGKYEERNLLNDVQYELVTTLEGFSSGDAAIWARRQYPGVEVMEGEYL